MVDVRSRAQSLARNSDGWQRARFWMQYTPEELQGEGRGVIDGAILKGRGYVPEQTVDDGQGHINVLWVLAPDTAHNESEWGAEEVPPTNSTRHYLQTKEKADPVGRTSQANQTTDEVVVAQDGSGDYETVLDAVEAAPDGARIVVLPGRYVGAVELTRPVTIFGDGPNGDIAIWTDDGDGVAVTGRNVTIENMSIELAARKRNNAVFVRDGSLKLVNCQLKTLEDSVVLVRGPHAEAQLRGCVIEDAPKDAVRIVEGARVELSECSVSRARGRGVSVDSSAVSIMESRISMSYDTGIDADRSAVRIRASSVSHSGSTGIRLKYPQTSASVEDCTIELNGFFGVWLHDGAKATMKGTTVKRNNMGGVSAKDFGSALECFDCEFVDNQNAGLEIKDGATATTTRGRASGNEESGLVARGPHASLTIEGTVSEGNFRHGCFIGVGAAVSASGAALNENAWGGACVDGFRASLELRDSRLRANEGNGLWVKGGGSADVHGCDIVDNGSVDVAVVDTSARVVVEDNTIGDAVYLENAANVVTEFPYQRVVRRVGRTPPVAFAARRRQSRCSAGGRPGGHLRSAKWR